jgi:uncharacterized BrkB/YihY/UPF0761 family membrane protein
MKSNTFFTVNKIVSFIMLFLSLSLIYSFIVDKHIIWDNINKTIAIIICSMGLFSSFITYYIGKK